MDYNQTLRLIGYLKQEDKAIVHKIALVSAIRDNMDMGAYDAEGFEELCQRIDTFIAKQPDCVDYDTFMYCVNSRIENGLFETPNEECLADAWEWASTLD